MGSIGSQYERELRSVLAGEINGVRAVTRSCSEAERSLAMRVTNRPFLVVRAPGSGSEGTGDLLALRGDICFPIEVKSSKKPRLYLSGRTYDQLKSLKDMGERCGLLPLYAYRLKGVRGYSWRIMKVEVSGLSGKLRHLSRSIPSLPLTRNGKEFLDWEQGMPLHKFLSLICKSDSAVGSLEVNQSEMISSYIAS